MSEYQYYEFQALDKPLTKQQQKELRSLSSRAEITATSFVNEYNYGDFRGEPQKLMERYFDAFCYLANWGTRRLMFRLPKTVLDAQTARRYCHSDAASVTETADHVIIDLCLERDPDDEWLEGSGLLAGMVQARSDLAAGDLRLLYLAWLLGIQRADEEDDDFEDETEPPVPAGLGELSAPLEAIAEFLEIYEDLLAVAAEASPQAGESQPDALAAWVLTLPATEKDTLLTMLASGQERRHKRCCSAASATLRPLRIIPPRRGERQNCWRRLTPACWNGNAPRRNAAGSSKDARPLPRPQRTPSVSMTSRPREMRPGNGSTR